MTAKSPCPDTEALHRLAANELPPDEAFDVQRHVVRCLKCKHILESIRDSAAALPAITPPSGFIRPERDTSSNFFDDQKYRPTRPMVVSDKAADFSTAQPPETIERLGRFRVLRRLGGGGMGIVYEAEDTQLKRRVALKVLKPDQLDEAGRTRFFKEAEISANIEHDHIVTIYDIGEENGTPFLAMQLLRGQNLEQRLSQKPPLTIAEVVRIGKEIALGLAAAHQRGLIHRDIKPSNIWLDTGVAKPFRVKILDFGLARNNNDYGNLTKTGYVMGTPGYMSPEQARGQTIDNRADLFSLGCVLYEMATGREPFAGPDPMARLTALAVEEPPAPRKLNPSVPEELEELILALLAKNPDERPYSAEKVAEFLSEIGDRLAATPEIASRSTGIPRSRSAASPPDLEEIEDGSASAEGENTVPVWFVIVCLILAILAFVGVQILG
ncbi:MAG: hypothetical protein KatS3mg105_2737 [Gemmatales bacterium]|nr:MAG: hypothetical protein KatS3mg105_2737 [Gemmatales bacterium]